MGKVRFKTFKLGLAVKPTFSLLEAVYRKKKVKNTNLHNGLFLLFKGKSSCKIPSLIVGIFGF